MTIERIALVSFVVVVNGWCMLPSGEGTKRSEGFLIKGGQDKRPYRMRFGDKYNIEVRNPSEA